MIERILYNGNIITLNAETARATALAITMGRVVAVGADDEVRALATATTKQDNLHGQVAIPGLVDAHIHWERTANAMHEVDVFEIASKQAAVNAVAARVQATPAGGWVIGAGWTQDLWAGRTFPTATDLDAVAPDNPVFLVAKSVHAAWANSVALRMAGIDADTDDPPGGEILRGADGVATGILLEKPAMDLVAQHIPTLSVDQTADRMRVAQQRALASGLTGLHDFDDPSCLAALQRLRERGDLALRVVKNINHPFLEAALENGLRWGFGDAWLRVGGLKMFADGALGPRTAYMLEPYENEPDNVGIVVLSKDEMAWRVAVATKAGLPSTIHAIGDRAVRDVLDVFAEARALEADLGISPAERRHRVEHIQVIHPADVPRVAELGLIASMQPIHATSDYAVADAYWGDRATLSYNARVQIDQGVPVAFGSDSPVEPFDPLLGIYAAVTRRHASGAPGPAGWRPDAKLTVDEALRGYTIGPAYAAGTEQVQGQLAPGFLADLVLLDADPYAADPNALKDIAVVSTMVGGVWRYGAFAES